MKRHHVIQPPVAFSAYWVEWVLLGVGATIPVATALIWRTGSAFARSGSLTVFCAAVAEFMAVNRLTKKHILNAIRARDGEEVLGVSTAATRVGLTALVVGLIGTFIWGFGDAVWR